MCYFCTCMSKSQNAIIIIHCVQDHRSQPTGLRSNRLTCHCWECYYLEKLYESWYNFGIQHNWVATSFYNPKKYISFSASLITSLCLCSIVIWIFMSFISLLAFYSYMSLTSPFEWIPCLYYSNNCNLGVDNWNYV